MKRIICGASALLFAMTACSAGETSNEGANETASYLAALEVNEDGSNVEVADATGEEPRLMRGCAIHAVRERLRRDFDRDADGELTEGERSVMREEFDGSHRGERRARFGLVRDRYDADGSGDLDAEERATLEADLDARCERKLAELLERFDADGSGELDESEWEAVHAEIRARFAENHAELVERFDTDGDGELDETERRAARDALADELREQRQRAWEEADLDGSGTLDHGEREGLRKRFAGPRPGAGFGGDAGALPL